MNSLAVIAPWKYEGLWVFDDPKVGLVLEQFVAGIDTMIDQLVAPITPKFLPDIVASN